MINGAYTEIYLVKTVLPAELAQVTRSNGYSVNIGAVIRADFPPDYTQLSDLAVEKGSVFVIWTGPDMAPEGQIGGPLAVRCQKTIVIAGAMQQPKDIDTALLGMAVDLKRVMFGNLQRKYPGQTTPNAITTWQAKPIEPWYEQIDERTTVGVFFSEWIITYQFPVATG